MRWFERTGVGHIKSTISISWKSRARWSRWCWRGRSRVRSEHQNPVTHSGPRGRSPDVARLQTEFADVFLPLPGRTNLIQHHIEMEPGVVVHSRPYRLPEHKKKVVQSELEAMLEMGLIEESHSDWASPIILVPKTDGSVRFCVDYRKVNAVSKFDAYPMARVDKLLDRLGTAHIYSTLDLTKGYWQIPLITYNEAFSKLAKYEGEWWTRRRNTTCWVCL